MKTMPLFFLVLMLSVNAKAQLFANNSSAHYKSILATINNCEANFTSAKLETILQRVLEKNAVTDEDSALKVISVKIKETIDVERSGLSLCEFIKSSSGSSRKFMIDAMLTNTFNDLLKQTN